MGVCWPYGPFPLLQDDPPGYARGAVGTEQVIRFLLIQNLLEVVLFDLRLSLGDLFVLVNFSWINFSLVDFKHVFYLRFSAVGDLIKTI